MFLGFPCGSAGKESSCNAGDLGLIPGLGRSPGEGKGYALYPLQYSGLENSMDYRGHGVTRSQIRLSDFHIYIYISKVIQDTGARGKQLTRTQDTHSSPLSTALSLFIATLPSRPFMVSRCSVLVFSMNQEVQETFKGERQIQP